MPGSRTKDAGWPIGGGLPTADDIWAKWLFNDNDDNSSLYKLHASTQELHIESAGILIDQVLVRDNVVAVGGVNVDCLWAAAG